jgi:hypothetical protein
MHVPFPNTNANEQEPSRCWGRGLVQKAKSRKACYIVISVYTSKIGVWSAERQGGRELLISLPAPSAVPSGLSSWLRKLEFRRNPEFPELRRPGNFGRSPFQNSGVPEIADCTGRTPGGEGGEWKGGKNGGMFLATPMQKRGDKKIFKDTK